MGKKTACLSILVIGNFDSQPPFRIHSSNDANPQIELEKSRLFIFDGVTSPEFGEQEISDSKERAFIHVAPSSI